ncbi:c-type cytochrome biogenesis protein CcmI [Orrella marina]|uniref:C-type cytochrome biogenesis protein CcmI n=1 Tax=Orrella marina TaxID=2163011 RepID=A0A2R4XJE0_9BURK|nr:c-type cytochrome biogenesis protein CcmI [Orrella marina]AWB33910.1 c-type cytochrome biogenesis protein CcmI [Orrella marina]
MNIIFIVLAALLVSAVALRLGLVLWRGPRTDGGVEHHVVNASVLRDQFAELDRDRRSGTLSEQDHAEAVQDLQRRVLEEAKPPTTIVSRRPSSKYAALGLAIVLPLASTLIYLRLGNPAAISPVPVQSVPNVTQADVQAMVDSLAARLALNPDDPAGWLMLARSYRYFDRYEDAANAFAKAGGAIKSDPLALTEYAEALVRSSSNGFVGEPTALLGRALALNPKEPFALTLAGAAALERRDYDQAINYWQQLRELLPPDSDAARAVNDSIERARGQRDQNTPSDKLGIEQPS